MSFRRLRVCVAVVLSANVAAAQTPDAPAPTPDAAEAPAEPPPEQPADAPVDAWSRTISKGVKQENGPSDELAQDTLSARRRIRPVAYVGTGAVLPGDAGDTDPLPALELAGGIRYGTSDSSEVAAVLSFVYAPGYHNYFYDDNGSTSTNGYARGNVWGLFPQVTYRARPLSPTSVWYLGGGARIGIWHLSASREITYCYTSGSGSSNTCAPAPDLTGIAFSLNAVLETGFLFGHLDDWDLGLAISGGYNATGDDIEFQGGTAGSLIHLGKAF